MVQSINDAALFLAGQNKWNDLFNGTEFILVDKEDSLTDIRYLSTAEVSSTYHLNSLTTYQLSRQGYSWSKVSNTNAQMIGLNTQNNSYFSFGPAYHNPKNYLATWKTGNGKYLLTTNESIPSQETAQWTPTHDTTKTSPNYFFIKLNISDSTVPLSFDTIVTTPKTTTVTFAISVVNPGPNLLQAYCTLMNAANVATESCVNYCPSSWRECDSNLRTYCAISTNTNTTPCLNWFRNDKYSNSDDLIRTSCADYLTNGPNNTITKLMNSEYADLCGCFLSIQTMTDYADLVSNYFGFPIPANKGQCYFPPCSVANKSVPPTIWKTSCNNCSIDSGCITNVQIEYVSGKLEFIQAPTIFNSTYCSRYNHAQTIKTSSSDTRVQPSTIPTIPNACLPRSPTKTIHTKHNKFFYYFTIFLTILIVLLLAILVLRLTHKPKTNLTNNGKIDL